MGEAKRRKAILGNRFGTPETSKYKGRKINNSNKLKPDYGHHYVKTFGIKPINLCILNPMVLIAQHEAYINFIHGTFFGTVIVTPEFAKTYKQKPLQFLEVIPDPNDAYVAPNGDRVLPFKLVLHTKMEGAEEN